MIFKLILAMLCLVSFTTQAESQEAFFETQATSILVLDPETQEVIYEDDAEIKLIPASTTKLFPSLAILETLGPNYHFETKLFIKKDPKSKEAELILTSQGDPSFTGQDLKQLLLGLNQFSITTIKSFTLITPKTVGPDVALGWAQDGLPLCYSTPINSFIIDHNCFSIMVTQDRKITQSQDHLLPIRIENQLEWIEQDENTCVFEPQLNTDKTLTLSGCLPHRNGLTLRFALPLTPKRLSDILAVQFKSMNLKWTGPFKTSSNLPKNLGQLVASHKSPPLQELIYHALQESDNLYAEFFLRQLSLHYYKVSSFKMGVKALSKHFKEAHLEIQDGSGLSHYNLISARQFAKLLTQAYQNRLTFPLWLSFLPIAGQSGTLERYFKEGPLHGKLFAKTGTLTHVNTLAGYFEYKPQAYWVVVVMALGNGYKQSFYEQVDAFLQNLSNKNSLRN